MGWQILLFWQGSGSGPPVPTVVPCPVFRVRQRSVAFQVSEREPLTFEARDRPRSFSAFQLPRTFEVAEVC